MSAVDKIVPVDAEAMQARFDDEGARLTIRGLRAMRPEGEPPLWVGVALLACLFIIFTFAVVAMGGPQA